MPRLIAMGFVVAVALLAHGAAEGQQARQVTGQTRGLDPAARERAIELAVREAVLQALQELVPARRITPYEPLLERAGEFLTDMRIVDYDARDGITTIEIAAQLNEAALRTAIAEAWLQQSLVAPRVVVLSAVRADEDPYTAYAGNPAQVLAEDLLNDAGLAVIGLDTLTEYADFPALAALAAEGAARELARAHLGDAALVLLVTVSAETLGQASNLVECTARISAIVSAPHSEAPVLTEQVEALVRGANPEEAAQVAIESATRRLLKRVQPMIILAAAATEPRSDDIVVTIEGALESAHLDTLHEHFAAIQGVEEVEVLFQGVRGARLRVRFPQSPGAFIEPALETLPPTLRLEIVQVVDREMLLRAGASGE